MKFAILSDPQFGNSIQEAAKRDSVTIIRDFGADFVLIPGDITDTARDGSYINWIIKKIFYPEENFRLEYQLRDYKKKILRPLESGGIPVYAVMGNHDTYNGPLNYVLYYIATKYRGLFYKKKLEIGSNLPCIVYGLHIYPGRHIMKWLRYNYDTSIPGILFFHYPLESDDFPESARAEFVAFLEELPEEGRPICIAVGHWHRNLTLRSIAGIPVICAGGSGAALCNWDPKCRQFKCKFVETKE